MKKQTYLISRFALTAVTASALCLGSNGWAQTPEASAEKPNPLRSMAGVGEKPSKKEQAAATTSATPGAATQLDMKDKNFMVEAAKGGLMEVEMGKMAQAQGQSSEVKNIGKTMVADHSKANSELMALASKKGVQIAKTAKMEKMDSANFDQAYLQQMVKDHEKDVAAFEREARGGVDPEVKSFASKTLPTLKKHLTMVKSAQGKVASAPAKKS